MKRDMLDKRVFALTKELEVHCRSLDLMATDFGKALNRIKVNCYEADLDGLVLEAAANASSEVELVAMFFAAFKRAQKAAKLSDCVTSLCSMGEYAGSSDKTDETVAQMKRAIDALTR